MVLVILAVSGGPALGHEQRQVGPYTIEIGWRDEPALAGLLNAIELEVRETASSRGVDGLAKTLTLTVSFGGATATFEPALRSLGADDPGHYVADLIPTAAGDYLFRLRGKIGAQDVNELFESGPGRFDSVRSASTIAFPSQAALDPSVARDLQALRETADQARAAAVVGLVVGALGLAGAVIALKRRP